jgi:uncharacterized membrane protein YgaE (UPF0421/DUF939 family)
MKTSLIIFTTITVLSVLGTQACDRTSNKMEKAQTSVIEAERDLEIAKSEIEADLRIYRQEIASKLNENNLDIANIKEKIQNEEAEIKAAHEVRIANLERTNDNLKRQIDNFGVTNKNNWDDFKEDFNTSMDNLSNSLDDFFSKTNTSTN